MGLLRSRLSPLLRAFASCFGPLKPLVVGLSGGFDLFGQLLQEVNLVVTKHAQKGKKKVNTGASRASFFFGKSTERPGAPNPRFLIGREQGRYFANVLLVQQLC